MSRSGSIRVAFVPPVESVQQNPYLSLLAESLQPRGSVVGKHPDPDVVHVHWPEHVAWRTPPIAAWVRYRRFVRRLLDSRRRGVPLVWTVHNLMSHSKGRRSSVVRAFEAVEELCDGWISLSDTARSQILERFPRLAAKPSITIPHGHYRPRLAPEIVDLGRTAAQHPEKPVKLGLVGNIRENKGVGDLIEAFVCAPEPDMRLVIAGRVAGRAFARELARSASRDGRITLEIGAMDSDAFARRVAELDVMVLPYTGGLISGAAWFALSCYTRILVPAGSPQSDLIDVAGPGWVSTFAGSLTAEDLSRAVRWAAHPAPASDPVGHADWRTIGSTVHDFYKMLLEGKDA
jgi:beta-1,4-mannosyltransferase